MDLTLSSVTPALESPNGVHDFENPQNIHSQMRIVAGLCIAIPSLFMLLRICTRFFLQNSHGWEDYTMILAWLSFIGYVALGLEATKYGYGVQQWDVRLSDFFVLLKYAHNIRIFYNCLILVTKVSILLQLQRLFCPHRMGSAYRIIFFIAIFNLLFHVASTISQILTCSPQEKIWHPYVKGQCLNLPRHFDRRSHRQRIVGLRYVDTTNHSSVAASALPSKENGCLEHLCRRAVWMPCQRNATVLHREVSRHEG
ncbi:hypothetical protein BDV95DRAFT_75571 [Massariosphaeria phaeospora]|uniref:Rhodopsin domain-containing protein n=1 Tax=Massariosphaeria phaeospora TaxID=100035 RepID=A0A7C8MIE0_9PLEO|nr:hypothetical protein BDV95DRAFT_75571 [Massariosphaeria phaeospora]